MSVVEAVDRDLAALREIAPELADSAMAATALALAGEIDRSKNSATSKAMCAKVVIDIFEQLRELAPERGEREDRLVDLTARRAARLTRSSTA